MIAWICGNILEQEGDSVLLDVGGIGYQVLIPVQQISVSLQPGKNLTLYTHLQVREDNWTLFGFANKEQLNLFKLLLTVNGVGARTALSILNLLAPSQILLAIQKGEYKVFNQVPGIGNKISQRIVLELKEKIKLFGTVADVNGVVLDDIVQPFTGVFQDAVLAMEQLGYSNKEASMLIHKAEKQLQIKEIAVDVNGLIKEALRFTLEK